MRFSPAREPLPLQGGEAQLYSIRVKKRTKQSDSTEKGKRKPEAGDDGDGRLVGWMNKPQKNGQGGGWPTDGADCVWLRQRGNKGGRVDVEKGAIEARQTEAYVNIGILLSSGKRHTLVKGTWEVDFVYSYSCRRHLESSC